MLGSKTIVTTLSSQETDELQVGQYSIFGVHPLVARKYFTLASNGVNWNITHVGFWSRPLSEVEISGDTLVIFLKYSMEHQYLPTKLYRAIENVLKKGGAVWLVTVGAFTLNQSPVISTCYELMEMIEGEWSYVHFVCEDGQSIQLNITDEPEKLVKSEWFPETELKE